MITVDIRCGVHTGTVTAPTIGKAWRKLIGEKTDGFAPLARWRLRAPNGKIGGRWQYQTPQSLDAHD